MILILGAGRSSSSLINYLLKYSVTSSCSIVVGDISREAAEVRIAGYPKATAIHFDIEKETESRAVIAKADVVVSLMPAHLHIKVAKVCIAERKHLLTASYVSDEMKALEAEVRERDLLFLNECGLDPGIDHMSAMQVIDKIKSEGGILTSFESFTGGLIAPETDPENPWRYKFTWNPRNVVMAGQSTAKFLEDGKYKYIPYQQLFSRLTPVSVPDYGEYEGYANRDSLKYMQTYGLEGIKTMLRGTLRNKGYCPAWNVLVQLGCCDDTYQLEHVSNMTHRSFMESFTSSHTKEKLEERIAKQANVSASGAELQKLAWSGLFSEEKVGLDKGTPAQVLEHILNKKWKLKAGDKDFVVMWHRFRFEVKGKKKEIQAYLTATGEDEINTAMAKTVGLPIAIAARLLVEGKIKKRGVAIPVMQELYEPILKELGELGIQLKETYT